MALVLSGQVPRVLEVARLAAHADRRVEVERQLTALDTVAAARLGLDKAIKPVDVLELCVSV